MSSNSNPPPQSLRYITTHDSSGKAVFSDTYPTAAPTQENPFGILATIYTTSQFPADLTADADFKLYDKHVENPPNVVAPGGTAVALVSVRPGAESPMHRTVSLDYCVVLEGEIEFELDSGEKRTLNAGDTYVQRGTCHKFTNVTPGGGWAKLFAVSQEIKPVEVNGEALKEHWEILTGI
jgi:quercetin dioxygenase-like cupin family protein